MSIKASEVLKIAKAEVGVHESPIGSKNVKYNTEYYGHAINNKAYAWCVVFLWWCFKHAGGSSLFYGGYKTASCPVLYNYCVQQKLIVSTPKPGDIVFYDWDNNNSPNHVGFVYSVESDGSIWAIEGNTSANNQSNGGYVELKKRAKKWIWRVARPKYAAETTSETIQNAQTAFIKSVQKGLALTETGKATTTLLSKTITLSKSKNAKHPCVKAVQTYLTVLGFNCGTVDGIFGEKTDAAVKAYQKAKSLTSDGEITAKGPTWKKLLGLK